MMIRHVLEARASLNLGKAPGGTTAIVAEMIKSLPLSMVYLILDTFRERYANPNLNDTIESWNHILMIFIPKKSHCESFEDFRGISLLDGFQKWYLKTLIIMAKECSPTSIWSSAAIFGFESGFSVEHLAGGIRLLLGKAREWRNLSCWSDFILMAADVKQAFDDLTPTVASEGLRCRGVHPALTAAITRENLGLRVTPSFPGVPAMEPIDFDKSSRQGGVETTMLWNSAMAAILSPLHVRWVRLGWGIHLDGRYEGEIHKADPNLRFTHLIWADNIYLLCVGLEQARSMMTELTQALEARGFRWKDNSLAFLSPRSGLDNIACQSTTQPCHTYIWKQSTEVEVLGMLINSAGTPPPPPPRCGPPP